MTNKFNKTKWDTSDWTIEQKKMWQLKIFELGYSWLGYGRQTVGAFEDKHFFLTSGTSVRFLHHLTLNHKSLHFQIL